MKVGNLATLDLKIKFFKLALIASLSVFISSCSGGGGGDSSFSFAESGGNGDPSTIKCAVSSATPSSGNTKVASTAGRLTTFTVAANTTACAITYYLNGSLVTSSGGSYALDPASLTLGTNTLTAKLTNAISEATVSWNLLKNNAPSCSSQSPSTVNQTMSALSSMSLTASAIDGDGDPLTFTWKVNGALPAAGIVTPIISAPTASQISFTPDGSLIGSSSVAAVIDDGYDQVSCAWNMTVNGDCAITGSLPAVSSMRMPQLGTANQLFQVTTATAGCSVNWTINANPIAGTTAIKLLTSSQLMTGANIVQASTGVGSPKTWTVVRNSPPSCTQNPATSPIPIAGVGGTRSLVATASDSEGDTITASWNINGSPASGAIVIPSASGNVFTGQLVPDSSIIGSISVAAILNDGYDNTSCTWPVTVLPACSVSSSTPSGASIKIAAASGTNTSFGVTPNDSNCAVTWTLNGATVSTTPFFNLASTDSNLNSGAANTLVASLSNGSSPTVTRTWTINKNQPPTCSVQSPLATGNTLNVGSTLNLTSTAGNPDSDPLTVAWSLNGGSSSLFSAIVSTGNDSSSTFTPLASNVGANQKIRATYNDTYDVGYCEWNVDVGDCSIVSSLPAAATVRMLSPGSTSQIFQLATSTAGCAVTWKINGVAQAGTSNTRTITSSQILNGGNVVTATVGSGASQQTQTWTVVKNSAPTCTQSPAISPVPSVGQGGSLSLNATVNDNDADSVTATWLINGSTPGAGIVTPSVSGSVYTGVLTPDNSISGTINVSASLNDGYETAACTWPVKVNPACSIASSSPGVSSLKVAAASGTTTAFGIVPNDSSCAIDWKLNGVTVGTGSFLSLASNNANLSTGSGNTLVATLSNGSSAPVTQTWTLTKNSPPLCASQNPSATGQVMNYTNTKTFTSTITNTDSDSLTMTWTFNGGNSGLFSSTASSTTTAVATLNPTITQVGNSQLIRNTFSDGYDSGYCEWAVDIADPSSVNISACLPSSNPAIVTSPTGNSNSVSFVVAATGPNLTYAWKKNGTDISGATTSTLPVSSTGAGSWSAGTYTLKAVVTDQYAHTAECNWNVKINAKPVISSPVPSTASTYKMNFASSLNLSVTATDGNTDSLTYAWTINGNTNAALTTGSSTSTFSPNSNAALLGNDTITVTVSDGIESDVASWTVQPNQFSQACNDLWNGPSTGGGATGGKVCTLVGQPGVGDTLYPASDQSLIRIRPNNVIDDGSGNLIFADTNLNTVFLYNRSGSNITRHGITVMPGQLRAILGNGGNGRNSENQILTGFKFSSNTQGNNNNPTTGLAYDSSTGRLFVADYNNHRVIMMDSTGTASTVLGTYGTTQNSTTNADGNLGFVSGTPANGTVCDTPVDLKIGTYGGYKQLYVSCYNSHQIKRLAIEATDPNYMKAYTVAGQLNASSTAITGNLDGPIGAAGQARLNGPWALDLDADGNIYFTENSGHRLRMINMSGSSKSFFSKKSITGVNTFTISAIDAAGSLTSGTSGGMTANIGTTANKILINGPNKIRQGQCVAYRVQTVNSASGIPTAVAGSNLSVTITTAAGGSLYTTSACTGGATSINLTVPVGQIEQDFYYSQADTTARSLTSTNGSSYTDSTLSLATNTGGGAANKFAVYVPAAMDYRACTKVTIQVQDSSNAVVTAGSARTIYLQNTNMGSFYSDSSCSSQIFSVAMGASNTEAYVYYSRAVVAPSLSLTSLAGYAGSAFNPVGQGSAGQVGLWNPRGVAVKYSGSTVQGFFVSNLSSSQVHFINNTSSDITYGGVTTVGDDTAGSHAHHQGRIVAGTGSSAYNGDNNLASSTRLNAAMGLFLNSGQSTLWIADNNNSRVRYMDLSINNGLIDTVLGQGNFRYGALSDSPQAAPAVMLNKPTYIVMDLPNSLMYFADSSNGRVRQVNMSTGSVQTMVGKGIGAGSVESEVPGNVLMQNAKGVAVHNPGTGNMLFYVDSQSGCNGAGSCLSAANQNCLVRSYNATNTSSTVFGVTIPAQRVSTIAGDYLNGCGSYSSGVTVANNQRLNAPEGLVSDGTNLLLTITNDHCVVKLTPSGGIANVIGNCSPFATTPAPTDGVINATTFLGAQLSYPTAIIMDPLQPGNFLVADAANQGTSRIRYVNTRGNSVSLCGGVINVPAVSGGNSAYVQTMINFSPSGTSGRINTMAMFGNMLCWTSGLSDNADTGAHAIYCADRTSNSCTQTRILGPDYLSSNPIRGGGPLGNEQEGILGVSATTYAPYGLAFDSDGNLYFADRNNHTIRMIRKWW